MKVVGVVLDVTMKSLVCLCVACTACVSYLYIIF